MRTLVALLVLAIALPRAAAPQRVPVVPDSTRARCLAVSGLAPTCEGRALNAVTATLIGAAAGALPGYVGGSMMPTRCIGNGERAAVRGAIVGAAAGLVTGLLARQVSRRELAARDSLEREEARRHPVRPWSWSDLRPAVEVVGVTTALGVAVGVSQGVRRADPCGGVGYGALRGASVYGGGTAAAILGGAIVVRLFF